MDIDVLVVMQHYGSAIPEGHRNISARLVDAVFRGRGDTLIVSIETWGGRRGVEGNVVYAPAPGVHRYLYRGLRPLLDAYLSIVAPVAAAHRPRVVVLLNVPKELYLPITRLLSPSSTVLPYFYNSPLYFTCPERLCRLRYAAWRLMGPMRGFRVMATCAATARLLSRITGAPGYHVPPVIPRRFTMPRVSRSSARRRPSLGGELVYLYVGQLEPRGGVDVLLEAWRTAYPRLRPARLLVAPAPSDYTMENKRLFEAIGETPGTVLVQGSDIGIEELYAAADVVVLPFTESFYFTAPPLVLLEAMAMGKTVVATSVPCVTEWVVDGVTGLLAPPRDPGALAEKLVEAADAPDVIGETARRLVHARSSPSAVKKLIDRLLENLAGPV